MDFVKEIFLNELRDRSTSLTHFRTASVKLSKLMAFDLATRVGKQSVTLVPILRAGLVLLPAFQELFEAAPIGLFGIRRQEKTASPQLYYQNLPPLSVESRILLLDPMLATGGSANLALDLLKAKGASLVTVVTVIAAPEGLKAVKKRHPEVAIYTVAVDEGLDAQKYIVPGLGDFGDRYFGTTH